MDRLKRAAWRDINFLTESHEAKEGRRLVVHELPGADVPVVEDLGAKARTWRVQAYFIGADYDLSRDKFLAALREPGAEWLVHPWLGRVWVRAQDWSVSERNAEGGMAHVSVDFVEGGAGVPQPRADLADSADMQGQRYLAAAVEMEPEAMGTNALTKFKAEVEQRVGQLRTLLARARMPLTMARAVLAEVDSALALWRDAQDVAADYKRLLLSVAGVLHANSNALLRDEAQPPGRRGAVGDAARLRVLAALQQAAPKAGEADYGGAVDGSLSGPDAQALTRNARLERAARAHWTAAVVADLALADYETVSGRDAALAQALGAVDGAVALSDQDVMRAVDMRANARFDAALAARAAVQAALRAQALEPTQARQVALPMPATVLAYRMGVAEDVLMARTLARHPLFVRGAVRV